MADVLQRVGASWDEEQEDPVVKFRGWARMAMPLAGFDIIEVKPPKVRGPGLRVLRSTCAAAPRVWRGNRPRSLLLIMRPGRVLSLLLNLML